MTLDYKVTQIEAWKIRRAYNLTDTDLNLISGEIPVGISPLWAALSFYRAIDVDGWETILTGSAACVANGFDEHCQEIFKGLPDNAATHDVTIRIFHSLLAATECMNQALLKKNMLELINTMFDGDNEGTTFQASLDGFIDALYNRTDHLPAGASLGTDYILLGAQSRPFMRMKDYEYYTKLFDLTAFLDKKQAILLLHSWGYPLQQEVKGLSRDIVEQIINNATDISANPSQASLLPTESILPASDTNLKKLEVDSTLPAPVAIEEQETASQQQLTVLTTPAEIITAINEQLATVVLSAKERQYITALLVRLAGDTFKGCYIEANPNTQMNGDDGMAKQGKAYCVKAREVARQKMGIDFDLVLI